MKVPAEYLRPFRPRAARWVASVLFVATVVATPAFFIVLAVNDLAMPPTDAVGTVMVAAVLAWLCFRQAAVRAVPTETGLTVRNFVRVRELTWSQVVAVRFGPNRPWAMLDLSDGTTLAVMAIQSADGEYGRREASRLAALIQVNEAEDR
ncbi:MAG TPA: PH domain-containing protein [Actinomycetaceae bacterium]|nr:PH domain-containing protein [Actinomycetaceae bacterium]